MGTKLIDILKPLTYKTRNRPSFDIHIKDCDICNEKTTDIKVEYFFDKNLQIQYNTKFYCRNCYKSEKHI